MKARKQQQNHRSDTQNGNWGTPGTNITWDRAQGNRGKQMNPNRAPDMHEQGRAGQDRTARPNGRRRR